MKPKMIIIFIYLTIIASVVFCYLLGKYSFTAIFFDSFKNALIAIVPFLLLFIIGVSESKYNYQKIIELFNKNKPLGILISALIGIIPLFFINLLTLKRNVRR